MSEQMCIAIDELFDVCFRSLVESGGVNAMRNYDSLMDLRDEYLSIKDDEYSVDKEKALISVLICLADFRGQQEYGKRKRKRN